MHIGHDLTEAVARMRAQREKVIETHTDKIELDATELEALRVEVEEALHVLAGEVNACKAGITKVTAVIQAIGKAADDDLRRK